MLYPGAEKVTEPAIAVVVLLCKVTVRSTVCTISTLPKASFSGSAITHLLTSEKGVNEATIRW